MSLNSRIARVECEVATKDEGPYFVVIAGNSQALRPADGSVRKAMVGQDYYKAEDGEKTPGFWPHQRDGEGEGQALREHHLGQPRERSAAEGVGLQRRRLKAPTS